MTGKQPFSSLRAPRTATGPDVALGTGALWAFTRDMQIDLGTYVGLHGDEPAATPFIGFSIRR